MQLTRQKQLHIFCLFSGPSVLDKSTRYKQQSYISTNIYWTLIAQKHSHSSEKMYTSSYDLLNNLVHNQTEILFLRMCAKMQCMPSIKYAVYKYVPADKKNYCGGLGMHLQ